MRKRSSALILSGLLATGAVGAVAITPASATTSDNAVTSRLAGIKSALSGLVSDGTLTQSQADKVAGTLDSKLPKRAMGGPGGHMGGMDGRMDGKGRHMGGPGGHMGWMGLAETRDAAAKALGLTPERLRTELRNGKALADVAKAQKVSVDSVVKAMVTAIEDRLAAAVKGGILTQAKADKMKTSLTQRITDRVNGVGHDRGQGQGQRPRGTERPSSADGTTGRMSSAPSSMA